MNNNIPKSMFENELETSMTALIKEDRYSTTFHGTGQFGWMKTIVRLDEGYTYTEFKKRIQLSRKSSEMIKKF